VTRTNALQRAYKPPRLLVTFSIELNVTLGHANFGEKLFVRLIGSSDTKPCTKFEVCSSSCFEDMPKL